MLNHFRTLLLNLPGREIDPSVPGEELLPLDYSPVTLPGGLLEVRQVLFGNGADAAMLNYRAWQYLTLVHATELEEYVLLLDRRITYDTAKRGMADLEYGSHVQQLAGEPATLSVSGQQSAAQGNRMQRSWLVSVLSSSVATIVHNGLSTNVNYTTDADLSESIPLPGSELSIQFRPRVGAIWKILHLARPAADLPQVLTRLQNLSAEAGIALFSKAREEGSQEPMLTFANLWKLHRSPVHKLSGLLCGLVYSTELLRTT